MARELLPTAVTPRRYALTLEPDLESLKYTGTVAIEVLVNDPTQHVTLHSLDLELHSADIDGHKADVSHNADRQEVTLAVAQELQPGSTLTVTVHFSGILNDKMAGFYRSLYVDADGKTAYVATTQMEPTDCRRAFPCFDEPALKAKFDVTLKSAPGLVHLSNMDVKEERTADGQKVTVFNTSPVMLTYLVAFVVGDMRKVSCSDYKVPINVWATPGLEHLGQYSADLAAKALAFFDKAFDILYPLPKLDMVAIHDFSAGAMENFGLITYRNAEVLVDPKNTNIDTLKRITEVVLHELAHQWFGNLVTMLWWEGLWLNEGFATWMSWYACNNLYPDWKVWELYVADSLQLALRLDGLRLSHPIEVPVQRADEINQIFDAISYSKGSSLLKMLLRWLGEETFIKGVSRYLKKHKWGNTETHDLWESLAAESGKDVLAVMDVWTKKIGYPVITVEEGDGELTLTQHRFLATADVTAEEDTTLYPVFLGLRTDAGTDESLEITGRSITIPFTGDFFKLNADLAGIYRTAYSAERWQKLGEAGVAGKLTVEDRVGLVCDAGALASAGLIPTSSLFSLLKLWTGETSYVVWDAILVTLAQVKLILMFEDPAATKALNAFILYLILSKLKEIGYEPRSGDSFAMQLFKLTLFVTAVSCDDEKAVAFCDRAFAAYLAGDKAAVPPNYRLAIFSSVAKRGAMKEYEQLLQIYKNPQSVEEKLKALQVLSRFEDEEVLEKLISLWLDADVVKPQDIFVVMKGARSHRKGLERMWRWLTEEWETVAQAFPSGLSMLGIIVKLATSGFSTEAQRAEVKKFFDARDTKGFDQALAQSLDLITEKINWVDRDGASIVQWLADNGFKA